MSPSPLLFLWMFVLLSWAGCGKNQPDQFVRLMNSGKNYLDQGQAEKALTVYQKAVKLAPADADVHLNLANSYLLLGNATAAVAEADEVLKLDANSTAALYVKGCAMLRLNKAEEAVKALQTARNLDPGEAAILYHLGVAHAKLNQWDDAVNLLSEVVAVQPEHPTAHYQLSQVLLRAGRDADAQQELELHQKIAAQNAGQSMTPAKLEKSKYTMARVPFVLVQPDRAGISVRFIDDSERVFRGMGAKWSGPAGILDPNHSGTNSLFVFEPGQGFRLLWNRSGIFEPAEEMYPAIPGANYSKILVGDLQNDRFEDVVALSDKGTQIFKFATNGMAMDVGPFSRLGGLAAGDGVLVDLDFTGKLDLVAVTSRTNDLRLYRQFGPLFFSDITSTSGIPSSLTNAAGISVEDWPKDEMMDLIVGRTQGPPLLLEKLRGGSLVPTNGTEWPAGSVIATGDLNNDLRADLVAVEGRTIHLFYHGTQETRSLASSDAHIRGVVLFDYDNDGWLDLWTFGDRLSAWRNAGPAGFQEVSGTLGLDALHGPFSELHFADFDMDGDSDALASLANGGLRYLRNEGGNQNLQLKLRLFGNRSNASGLGTKVEVTSGGLRLIRTVQSLPVEIGVGKNKQLESVVVHWFNLAGANIDVPVDPKVALPVFEMVLPEGSCPYLYAWDGTKYRFITDILGAAPAGLPVADGVYIEADPDEFVWLGNETTFLPKNGYFTVQITEELREALYLDEVKLVAVDHPIGTEVHPQDKLVPRRPFPPSALLTLEHEHALQKAETLSGRDVTEILRHVDGRRVSPEKLRVPQLRGLAEPHGIIVEFDDLNPEQPLVLVLNGWLRFGGGMANINASHDPFLPFPFPALEAEVNGQWQTVNVTVGAPAGKTKSILVDLTGKLPRGVQKLKLSTAFEIHWDRIALMEKAEEGATSRIELPAIASDLHWRGFSEFEDLPWDSPLTPDYNRVTPNPQWRITPAGWCTRYGSVNELIARRDEGLLVMNGGDELTLQFAASEMPPAESGMTRDFFIYTDGWDKDADFHVLAGTTVEPLPWHGMNDQKYGSEPRPQFPSDALHKKYNTRWVAPQSLRRLAKRP